MDRRTYKQTDIINPYTEIALQSSQKFFQIVVKLENTYGWLVVVLHHI